MPFCLADLHLAQARIDAKTATYSRLRVPLNNAFLSERIDYDTYMRRSVRLRSRFSRELDRIKL